MNGRYAYVIPMGDHNRDADELEFWTRQGTLFEAHLLDNGGQYDANFYATRAEAIEGVHAMAAEMGWGRASYEFSIDE